jgi:hypothetical protein
MSMRSYMHSPVLSVRESNNSRVCSLILFLRGVYSLVRGYHPTPFCKRMYDVADRFDKIYGLDYEKLLKYYYSVQKHESYFALKGTSIISRSNGITKTVYALFHLQ